MPRQVFTDALEEKLIELWADYQVKKGGVMMKRAKKEKEIAEKLNAYAKETGETDLEFSSTIVHNKIDNLKSKAKDHYKRFRKATATGSAVDGTGDDAFDLAKAYTMWGNFKTWHRLFRKIPGFGPLSSISSVSLAEKEQSSSANQASSPCATPQPSPRPVSVLDSGSAVGVRRRATGEDSDEDMESVDPDPFGPESGSATSVPSTPTYKPGSLKKKFVRAADDTVDDEQDQSATGLRKKKKVVTNNTLAAGTSMLQGFAESQRGLQNSQQQFLTSLMKEQRAHTQMLAQSQMEFQAKLFGKFFSGKED